MAMTLSRNSSGEQVRAIVDGRVSFAGTQGADVEILIVDAGFTGSGVTGAYETAAMAVEFMENM